jgi:hypothetical protein
MFVGGYITQDIDSTEVLHGKDNFCQFFALFKFKAFENGVGRSATAMGVWVKEEFVGSLE